LRAGLAEGRFRETEAKENLMLRIYGTELEVLAELRPVIERIERRDGDLGRQMRRAASSVVLNTAEVAPGKAWEEEA
jgi:hypothetical protein